MSKQDFITKLQNRIDINEINKDYQKFLDLNVVVAGWIMTLRPQKKRVFMKLSDSAGSKIQPIQIVCDKKIFGETLDHLTAGASIMICGQLIKSPAPEQPFEISANVVHVLGIVKDPSSYPLAKADLPMDLLRTIPHLECHTPIKAAIYVIRSQLMEALINFFRGAYIKVDMPLITFSECEGGCQPMQTTLFLTTGKIIDIPRKSNDTGLIDFSKDFFGTKSLLTVSSQMELETQLPLGDVWTVTRAIRGEPSQTSKHLCEFSMIEFEKRFSSSAKDIIQISEQCIKFCIQHVLNHCAKELSFLEAKLEKPIITKLMRYFETPFVRITHAQAIDMIHKQKEQFNVIPSYSDDLSSEHEKFIVDHFGLPVVVQKYPKQVKAFYMPVVEETLEESHGVEHVDSFDILVPEVGELVGGSQRIHDADQLTDRIRELGIDEKPLEFYIELRRNGTIPHGGMGMGFERLVRFITRVDSVKDCVPFPRYIGCGKSQ